MSTFDLVEVNEFVASLDARMDRCENGEGMECATLDEALRHHASLCFEFTEKVREWGREIFAGRISLDGEVEKAWRREGRRLYDRGRSLLAHGSRNEAPCFILEGRFTLDPALWQLGNLLQNWVTPKLAVGPSARRDAETNPSVIEAIDRKINSLSPLPADWQPEDWRQKAMYRMLRRS